VAKISVLKDDLVEGSLPAVCVVCGAPATDCRFPGLATSLAWLLVLPCLLAFWGYVLVADRANEHTGGGFPFCTRHRHYWTRRGWFIIGGFVLMVAFVCVAMLAPKGQPDTETPLYWLLGAGGCWMLVYLPTFLALHVSAPRPVGNSTQAVILAGASRGFAEALKSQEEDRIRRFHSRQCDGASMTREEDSRDDHIQAGEDRLASERSPVGLEKIDCFPLSRSSALGGLGCAVIWMAGIAAAYSITIQMPGLPQVIFWPILAIALYLMFTVKQRLSQLVLGLDRRTLVFGPLWARKKVPFADIRAVQLLRVLNKGMVPYEINIVFGPHHRLLFSTLTDKLEAKNTAYALSDLVQAPVVEQIAAPEVTLQG
jgi:hypothetical protein